MATKKKLWFRAKYYGWGWYPVTWQGWFVVFSFLVFVLAVSFKNPNVVLTTILTTIATIILLLICYKTGEKPRWRWGK